MAAVESEAISDICVSNLESHLDQAAVAVEALLVKAKARLAARLMPGGKLSSRLLDESQHAAHGLAWLATYAATLRELTSFAGRLAADGQLGETERLTLQIAAGEYLNHVAGGIPMNQGEFVRLSDLGVTRSELAGLYELVLLERGNTPEARRAGSVGRPLPHAGVRVASDGQFMVSGVTMRGPVTYSPYSAVLEIE